MKYLTKRCAEILKIESKEANSYYNYGEPKQRITTNKEGAE
jgi:hypothetical protein